MGGRILKTVCLDFSFKEFCHKMKEREGSREDFFQDWKKYHSFTLIVEKDPVEVKNLRDTQSLL